MSKFDMIIGYNAVKKELKQIADTLRNREYYEKNTVYSTCRCNVVLILWQ